MSDLSTLQKNLGIEFKDISYLEQALVHSSYINENPDFSAASNERLEFLGDAILGMIVAEKLYRENPHLDEGKMTKMRANLVRRDTLAHIAKDIGLGDHLYLGKGEDASGGRHKPANLAAVYEAVLAAVYLDQGISVTRDFILKQLDRETGKVTGRRSRRDYKSELQEIIQAQRQQTPSYHVVQTIGPDHDKTFTVEVRLDNTVLGIGSGKNKKTAQSNAAHSALEKLANSFTP